MDGSCKRAVSGISTPKKKSITAAGSRDETGQLCNRIGCCGRLNHNPRGTKNKSLEKPKPLKPSIRSSSSKGGAGSSSKKCSKSVENSEEREFSKMESSSVPNEPKILQLDVSINPTHKLKSKSTEIRKEENNLRIQNRDSNNGRKKRLVRGESSSSGKGKKIIGVSTNESRVSDSKNSRNLVSSRTNVVSSVRTRKTLNLESSKGSNNLQSSNDITNMPQTQELSQNGDHSTSDASTDQSSVGSRIDNGTRHYNIDGLADVLRALERFEHDEELTYEQLLSLEANLFFGGLNFFDQHRDMRLDIDNMSYEELLVLEEKMGTVSTALPEEELSKCIKTGIYEDLQLENEKTRCDSCADDNKCSICQGSAYRVWGPAYCLTTPRGDEAHRRCSTNATCEVAGGVARDRNRVF
ncbi:hypothetical protein E3N88_27225 [Mikania micrantha]|uniref:RING-type E3 ubiquitin transferase n=1 Tax=Mikania micrantha TaxID=192012 RepID=A0A5N6MXL6_9ASTR|nr:hypothetical protein E3N88_27225 [Mikania micrantha]